eukprot:g4243.t1
MGNKPGASISEEDLMAITAMAHVVKFDKRELDQLQEAIDEKLEEETTITKDQFEEVMGGIKIRNSDREILDRMFILFDETGDAIIDINDYITGVRLLCKGSFEEHLEFVFKLYDTEENGTCTKEDVEKVFLALNNTIGWFGDKNFDEGEFRLFIEEITDPAMCNDDGDFEYAQNIPTLASMPKLKTMLKLKDEEK